MIQNRLRQVLHDLPRAVTVSFEMPDLEALYEMAEEKGECRVAFGVCRTLRV